MMTDTKKLPELTALELEKHISVPEAASFKSVSEWTFRRSYSGIIRNVSTRIQGVKVRDLLTAEPTPYHAPSRPQRMKALRKVRPNAANNAGNAAT